MKKEKIKIKDLTYPELMDYCVSSGCLNCDINSVGINCCELKKMKKLEWDMNKTIEIDSKKCHDNDEKEFVSIMELCKIAIEKSANNEDYYKETDTEIVIGYFQYTDTDEFISKPLFVIDKETLKISSSLYSDFNGKYLKKEWGEEFQKTVCKINESIARRNALKKISQVDIYHEEIYEDENMDGDWVYENYTSYDGVIGTEYESEINILHKALDKLDSLEKLIDEISKLPGCDICDAKQHKGCMCLKNKIDKLIGG